MKSGADDYIWREKNDIKIQNRKENHRIRRLNESEHMLGSEGHLTKQSIEINPTEIPLINTEKMTTEIKQ